MAGGKYALHFSNSKNFVKNNIWALEIIFSIKFK